MDPELLSVDQTCGQLGIGRTKFYELVADGRLEAVNIGRRTLIPRDAVKRFVDELRAGAATPVRAR